MSKSRFTLFSQSGEKEPLLAKSPKKSPNAPLTRYRQLKDNEPREVKKDNWTQGPQEQKMDDRNYTPPEESTRVPALDRIPNTAPAWGAFGSGSF